MMSTVTIVWVLMAFTSHNWTVPTLSFDSKELCEAAIVDMRKQVRAAGSFGPLNRKFDAYCVEVKK